MKPKLLEEWIKIYKDKVGEDPVVFKGSEVFFIPEQGFSIIKDDKEGRMIIIFETCGNGRFWRDFAEKMATERGYPCMMTKCIRHIRPYIRSFKWRVEREWNCYNERTKHIEDRYLCRDEQGRPVVITLADYDNKVNRYWVTQYLTTTQAPELKLSPNAKEIKHETEGENNV